VGQKLPVEVPFGFRLAGENTGVEQGFLSGAADNRKWGLQELDTLLILPAKIPLQNAQLPAGAAVASAGYGQGIRVAG